MDGLTGFTGGVDGGQGQDVLLAILNGNVEGSGLDACIHGDIGRSGLVGVEVLHRDLNGADAGRLGPVDGQDIVFGGGGDVLHLHACVDGSAAALTLGAVDADSPDLQSHDLIGVLQGLDVVALCVCTADEALGAVGVDGVDVVVADGVIGGQIPLQLDLAGAVEELVQDHILGSGRGIILAVGDDQAAQVDLVARNSLGSAQLQADGGDDTACVLAQVHSGGGPAGLQSGVLDGQNNGLNAAVVGLQGQGHADGGGIVSGGLVVGQSDGGAVDDLQLGLVEVDGVLLGQVTVDDQGGAAVVGADLGIVECALDTGELLAVIPVHIQGQGLALGLDPPLPGGQDVLEVQVGPLHIPGDLAAQEILHTVAVVEVGGEDSAVDDGLLDHILGEALEVDDTGVHVLTVHLAHGVGTGIFRSGGEVHALALFHAPLILGLVAVVVGAVVLVLIPVRTPDGEGGVGLSVLVHAVVAGFDVGAELPLATLDAHEDGVIGIKTQCFGVGLGIAQSGGAVPVVQEDGVGNVAVLLVPEPAVVIVVELVLIGDGAAVANGIVPLDVQALLNHPLDHVPEQGDIAGGDVLLLVDEVAVEAIELGDLDQLLGIGEVAVLILIQPLLGVLGNTGSEVLGQGQNAVLMGGVGGGRDGDGDGAVLKGADVLLHGGVDVLGGTAACTNVVGVLPELEHIEAKIVIGQCAVPGAVAGVSVAVVGGGDGIQLRLVTQTGIGLGGGIGADALLEGNLSHKLFGIIVRPGGPVQDVHKTVAVCPRLINGAGVAGSAFRLLRPDNTGRQQ